MATPRQIEGQINSLIKFLVGRSLVDDQRFAVRRRGVGNLVQVTFDAAERVSVAMRNRSYREIYQHLVEERAYNMRMLDGALLQMMYVFTGRMLQRHRLAFFSAPHLEEFQNNPEIYLNDEIYADVVARNIVPFPLRFDYDAREGRDHELVHPKSHLSLGQYENCRIPVTAPLTPFRFLDFILRNFYHTASAAHVESLPTQVGSFPESILPAERGVVYVAIPA